MTLDHPRPPIQPAGAISADRPDQRDQPNQSDVADKRHEALNTGERNAPPTPKDPPGRPPGIAAFTPGLLNADANHWLSYPGLDAMGPNASRLARRFDHPSRAEVRHAQDAYEGAKHLTV